MTLVGLLFGLSSLMEFKLVKWWGFVFERIA